MGGDEGGIPEGRGHPCPGLDGSGPAMGGKGRGRERKRGASPSGEPPHLVYFTGAPRSPLGGTLPAPVRQRGGGLHLTPPYEDGDPGAFGRAGPLGLPVRHHNALGRLSGFHPLLSLSPSTHLHDPPIPLKCRGPRGSPFWPPTNPFFYCSARAVLRGIENIHARPAIIGGLVDRRD